MSTQDCQIHTPTGLSHARLAQVNQGAIGLLLLFRLGRRVARPFRRRPKQAQRASFVFISDSQADSPCDSHARHARAKRHSLLRLRPSRAHPLTARPVPSLLSCPSHPFQRPPNQHPRRAAARSRSFMPLPVAPPCSLLCELDLRHTFALSSTPSTPDNTPLRHTHRPHHRPPPVSTGLLRSRGCRPVKRLPVLTTPRPRVAQRQQS